jgi:hypothetical protein
MGQLWLRIKGRAVPGKAWLDKKGRGEHEAREKIDGME